jgi:TldD protein
MRDRLRDALKAQDVEYADIRIEDLTNSWVSFRGPELNKIGSARTAGGIVRALWKGGWGYATFNDLDNLKERVKEACETARLAGGEKSYFTPIEPVVDAIPAELEKDFRTIPLSRKKNLMEEYNGIVLGHDKKIRTTFIRYADSFKKKWFASSEGSYIEEEDPDVNVMVTAVGRDGDVVQNAFETGGGSDGFQSVENFHDKARLAASRAVELLSALPVAGGTYTVISNPGMTGVFAHEAFGHLSESDFVCENQRMRELMTLGKRFGVNGLNIIDDGSIHGGLGTHRYDYEGVPTQKTYLIRDGVLAGRLHSRETAAKMGEKPTGNARAAEFQHPPIVRMTNTCIDKGNAKLQDMIGDIKLGVMAVNEIGGETALEMFTFSAAYGYMIRDGKVAELVRDVVLTGNVFETLMNIEMIGDEIAWHPNGPGGCGKANQGPLRVGLGGPYIRIRNCVVGGRQ